MWDRTVPGNDDHDFYVVPGAACLDGTPVSPEFVIGSYHELWNIEVVPHVKARPAGPPDDLQAALGQL